MAENQLVKKTDVVWMSNTFDKELKRCLVQLQDSNDAGEEARLDWYETTDNMLEIYSGEAPSGPRYTIYLVDEIKKIDEFRIRKSKDNFNYVLRLTLSKDRPPMEMFFPLKEEANMWSGAIKGVKKSAESSRKKLAKKHNLESLRMKKKNNKMGGGGGGGGDGDEDGENEEAVEMEEIDSDVGAVAFEVEIDSTAAALRNNAVGNGNLVLTRRHLTLHNKERGVIISWKYQYVKRFGHSTTTLSLEGGKRSGVKGQGLFIFRCCPGALIYKSIGERVKSLKMMDKSNSNSSLDDIDDYMEEDYLNHIYNQASNYYKKIEDVGQGGKYPGPIENVEEEDDYSTDLNTYDYPFLPDISNLGKPKDEKQNRDVPPKPKFPSKTAEKLQDDISKKIVTQNTKDVPKKPPILSQKAKLLPNCVNSTKMSDIVKIVSSNKDDGCKNIKETDETFYSSLNFLPDVAQQAMGLRGMCNGAGNFPVEIGESGNIYGEAIIPNKPIVKQICTDDAQYADINSEHIARNIKKPLKANLFKKK